MHVEPARHRDPPPLSSRVAAVVAVTATYFYFLIFANFALLELARPFTGARGILPSLAVLGVAGIAGSFGGAIWFRPDPAPRQLAWLFRFAALGAMLTVAAASRVTFHAACALTGLTLGALTVVLSASLRSGTGPARLGLCVGTGTGLAYFACNLPPVFTASPFAQSVAAASVALLASIAVPLLRPAGDPPPVVPDHGRKAETCWIIVFLALVGLDSAAFYIIQHASDLHAATWAGTSVLWGNAVMHLLAAVAAGWIFDRGGRARLVFAAMVLLVAACLALAHPDSASLPRMLYTAGVSLYSVVLVAYPAFGGRPWPAARIFAVSGWIGSGLGIGLALNLARIPSGYVATAATLLMTALWLRRQILTAGPVQPE